MYDRKIKRLIEKHSNIFTEGFYKWTMLNYDVWKEFERIALKECRRDYISATAIACEVRFKTSACARGAYKMPNVRVGDLARLFGLMHPQYAHKFKYVNTSLRGALK